jgi:hypothetical protein
MKLFLAAGEQQNNHLPQFVIIPPVLLRSVSRSRTLALSDPFTSHSHWFCVISKTCHRCCLVPGAHLNKCESARSSVLRVGNNSMHFKRIQDRQCPGGQWVGAGVSVPQLASKHQRRIACPGWSQQLVAPKAGARIHPLGPTTETCFAYQT